MKKGQELADWVEKRRIKHEALSSSLKSNLEKMGGEVVKLRKRNEGKNYLVKNYLVETLDERKYFSRFTDAKKYNAKLRVRSELFVVQYIDGFIYSTKKLA